MIRVGNIEVFGLKNAIFGMRNPLNSWDKIDSYNDEYNNFVLGENDKKLATNLIKAGTDHSKFMRQIFVTMDIEAPLYWWKEMDTYKVGTTANSCSTMHTLSKNTITANSFSFDESNGFTRKIIEYCESLRLKYLTTQDKKYWRELIQVLPSGWNQLRTWSANYQVLKNIYHSRKNHKLVEWMDFCDEIQNLPYSELITMDMKI